MSATPTIDKETLDKIEKQVIKLSRDPAHYAELYQFISNTINPLMRSTNNKNRPNVISQIIVQHSTKPIDFAKSLVKGFDYYYQQQQQQQNSQLSSQQQSSQHNNNNNNATNHNNGQQQQQQQQDAWKMIVKQRKILLEALIRHVNSEHFSGSTNDYIIFILDELDGLPESQVIEMTHFIFDVLRDESNEKACEIIDLLPKCLSIIYTCSGENLIKRRYRSDDDDESSMTGEDYHARVIQELCTKIRWTCASTIKIASIVKEITLREAEFDLVVSKIFEEMVKIHVSELPPLIYQLLLLSSKGKRREIIIGIINHFNRIDIDVQSAQASSDNLRSAESVVLQFVEFAVKQDHGLAKEVIKIMKDDYSLYSAYSISFLFVVATVPAFSSDVYKLLKSRIDQAYKDSLIYRYFYDKDTDEYENLHKDISLLIIETIQRSDKGREHILKSICDFGFFLLDSKRVTKHKLTFSLNYSAEDCHQLGMGILTKLFEIAHAARGQIIDTAFNHIVTGVGNVNKYTELIYLLVRNRPGQLAEHTGRFKETIDYFSYFDPVVASSFFEAVGPLVKANPDFQDSVVLVLRKALHSREQDSRLIALKGFLHILEAGSGSALSVGSSSTARDINYLDSDTLNVLRRCLTQQLIIRSSLYEGLVKVATARSELRDEIAKIFVGHLKEYINEKEGAHLDKCIDNNANLKEPLPLLLLYSFRLYNLYGQEETAGTKLLFDFYSEALGSMHEQEAEAHDLTPSSDYLSDSDSGRHNQMIASLLIGLNEVLIEIIVAGDIVENDGKTSALQTCINRINNLREIMKKGASKKDGKKTSTKAKSKQKTTAKTTDFNILLSLRVTNNILRMVLKANNDSEEEIDETYVNLLQTYVFNLCKKQLEEINIMGAKRLASIVSRAKELDMLGRNLMSFVTKFSSASTRKNDEKKKGKVKNHTVTAMECFVEVVRIFNMFGTERCFSFIESSLTGKKSRFNTQNAEQLDSLVESVTDKICRKVDDFIKVDAMDEATPLVNLCTEIVRVSSVESTQSLISWSEHICQQNTSSHTDFVKAVVQMYICVCGKTNKFENVKLISNDIMGEMGEFVTRANAHRLIHGIVDENTANSVALVLMECMSEFIAYLNWKLGKMKELHAEYKKLVLSQDESNEEKCEFYHEMIATMESKLCHVICSLCGIINYPCQTRLELSCFEKVNVVCVQIVRLLHDCSQFVLSKRKSNTSRVHVSDQLVTMTDSAAHTVSNIYHLVKYLDSVTSDNKLLLERARKAIPELFYRITEYTQVLSELSKSCGQNLLANFKRAPARQFQYKGEISDNDDDEGGSEEDTIPTKKKKTVKRKRKQAEESESENEEGSQQEEQVQKTKRSKITKHR